MSLVSGVNEKLRTVGKTRPGPNSMQCPALNTITTLLLVLVLIKNNYHIGCLWANFQWYSLAFVLQEMVYFWRCCCWCGENMNAAHLNITRTSVRHFSQGRSAACYFQPRHLKLMNSRRSSVVVLFPNKLMIAYWPIKKLHLLLESWPVLLLLRTYFTSTSTA